MAVHEKQIEVPATTRTVVDYISCDLCGIKTRDDENWKGESFNVDSTIIEIEQGSSFPEGKLTNTRRYNICPACFISKLEPFLKENGAKPHEFETCTF